MLLKSCLWSHLVALTLGLGSLNHAWALEAISDAEMAQATGEGIAFLPENFSVVFDPNAYINLIPVGPVTTGTQKADLFVYGLALGKSNLAANTTVRTAADLNDTTVGNITSWGTGSNPFVFRTWTFNGPGFTSTTEGRALLSLELPDLLTTETTAATGSDAYNLKLGLWTDIMVRDGTKVAGDANQFTQRLRLQGIWDGFSMNGTRLNLFQTASGSGTSSYNSTVGLTGIVRLNSGTEGVLRLSTALNANEASMITTPATGGVSPFVRAASASNQFDPDEGIFIKNLDVNLVLGQLNYQPLVLDASGSNIVIELARIPNNAAAYNAFYIDYSNATDIANKTCTATACGTVAIPATHSTISMGNVTFKDTAGTAVDLGSATISGLMIQHLKLTTTGL